MTFSSSSPAGIGIVGCGNISERYVKGISRFPLLKTLGCADMYQEAADKLSASTAISAYPSVDALLDDPGVDVVVNITSPVAHAEVSFAALKAGKHVYVEKPMGATVAEGRARAWLRPGHLPRQLGPNGAGRRGQGRDRRADRRGRLRHS
jgi:predicted dehydrogenase